MKKLEKLKLSKISRDAVELKKKEMKCLIGGSGACTCVCMGSSYPTGNYDIGPHSNSAV